MSELKNQTLSTAVVSKLIGCNRRHIRESLENRSFPFGFRFFTAAHERVYKVSKEPLMKLLEISENDIVEPENQTLRPSEAAKLIGSKSSTIKAAIECGTFPNSFYYITAAGTKVYRIAKKPLMDILTQKSQGALQ